MEIDPAASAGGIAAIIASAMAIFERIRSARAGEKAAEASQRANSSTEIIAGKDELIKIARESADSWKLRYENEHAEGMKERDSFRERYSALQQEFADHREKTHSRMNEANGLVLKYTEEIAALRVKTDITPLLKFQEEQSKINERMLRALNGILRHLNVETAADADLMKD